MKTTKAEQFCHDILNFDMNHAKALVNIIMALASEPGAQHPTELSLNPFFQYNYCILSDVMLCLSNHLKGSNAGEFKSSLRQLLMPYISEQSTYKLASDFMPVHKPHSKTLADRGFVYRPNKVIKGDKGIDVGYTISCVNLGLYDDEHPFAWSLPLDNQRVELDANKIAVAVQQLKDLLADKDLPFGKSDKVVNMADTGYAIPEYISPLIGSFDNLLLDIRLRYGSKVYKPYKGEQSGNGRNKEYEDEPYYLQEQSSRMVYNPRTRSKFEKAQRPIFELPCDEQHTYETKTTRGKEVIVQLSRWNDLLIRGTNKFKMGDKPFDLVAVRFINKKTGKRMFKNDMFIGLWGKNRRTHSTLEIQTDYKHRYDIEPHNRFSKQQLLMDKYQTSNVAYLEAWLYTVQLAYWLLYVAAPEIEVCVNPWEKHLPEVKRAQKSTKPKSVAITRKSTKRLFSTFDLNPFKPRESKNGKGRKKGTVLTKRKHHPPRRKHKNQRNCKQKIEQLE